jgi:hypothetical protein
MASARRHQRFARLSRRGRGCGRSCSCGSSRGRGRILWGLIFLGRLTWRVILGLSRGRILWWPRFRRSRRNGLLYGLLHRHGTRRTRGGLLPPLAITELPEEESEEESGEESDKRPYSNPQGIPPAASPHVRSNSPHGAFLPYIVVNRPTEPAHMVPSIDASRT